MIGIRSEDQIQKMRDAGVLLHAVLEHLKQMIQPGITTRELDQAAERMIRDAGAIPSFLGYNGFSASICASPDDQVVHGIPNDDPLEEGHLISVDCGVILHGWQSDSAFTAPIGQAPTKVLDLIRVTEESFWLGAKQAREGNRLGDISNAVQRHAESHGYGVIRDLCGHGIGQQMHEDPSIPNYGPAGRGVRLRAGMTLAIEPMIAMGTWRVFQMNDGWTVVTQDHGWCSHYEHTILVTDGDPEILSMPGANPWGEAQ
ncbi:type I methionyl aminopeptidase [Eubacteriales bacterium OttesenSCG-928-N13]|nr:type I methionyl aminopeptidase [Eubacteriales bacterium OttesenSCG-928-N13]